MARALDRRVTGGGFASTCTEQGEESSSKRGRDPLQTPPRLRPGERERFQAA